MIIELPAGKFHIDDAKVKMEITLHRNEWNNQVSKMTITKA